ncbi:hypothetical protein QBC34DRAFT_419049 [Podospora aff. communis PSN243]|uniref:RING-type domain-containing protein n=1 Tax=Podospora aff. communis PSN243 TaxID=3040156 RepID=A0AAV9G109_9PEZI|nr:hypothetical protein QBC34DRAFT_419049 [Podospora aff. communis PSN243]
MGDSPVFEEHVLWHQLKNHVLDCPPELMCKHPQVKCGLCFNQIEVYGVEVYEEGVPISKEGVVLSCGHMFCLSCVLELHDSDCEDICPTCRVPMTFELCGCLVKWALIPCPIPQLESGLDFDELRDSWEACVPITKPECREERRNPTTCHWCDRFYKLTIIKTVVELATNPIAVLANGLQNTDWISSGQEDAALELLQSESTEIWDIFEDVRVDRESTEEFIRELRETAVGRHAKGYYGWEDCKPDGAGCGSRPQKVLVAPMKAELLLYPFPEPPYVYFRVGEPADWDEGEDWQETQEEEEAAGGEPEGVCDEDEDQVSTGDASGAWPEDGE